MNIEKFTSVIENQFDDVDKGTFTELTKFKEFEEWSSLHVLTIIAAVDSEFGVIINGDDINNSQTIKDLFDLVLSKKK
jgi:acyl carrier protein